MGKIYANCIFLQDFVEIYCALVSLEQSLAPPGSFIHMVDGGTSRDLGDGFVVRQYGGGHSVDDVLNATLADPQTQDREEEILDDAPAVSLGSSHYGNHRRQSRAKARSLFQRNERLYYFLAMLAAPSIEDDVCHIQFNFREFDNLVDVVCGSLESTEVV